MFVTSCIFHETNEKFINWQKKIRNAVMRTRQIVSLIVY